MEEEAATQALRIPTARTTVEGGKGTSGVWARRGGQGDKADGRGQGRRQLLGADKFGGVRAERGDAGWSGVGDGRPARRTREARRACTMGKKEGSG